MAEAIKVNGLWVRFGNEIEVTKVIPVETPGGPVDPEDPEGEQLPPVITNSTQKFTLTRAWLEKASPEAKAEWGVGTYTPVGAPPSGQRSTGKVLIDDNGSPKEIHQLEDIPLADRKAKLITLIDAERDRRQQLDFVYDFGDIVAKNRAGDEIPAGVRRLQMRDDPGAGKSDQSNWSVLNGEAVKAIMFQQPDLVVPMRAEDNWNLQTTAVQVAVVLSAMVKRNADLLFFGGDLKDDVRAATTGSQLDAINIYVGWPA